MHQNDLVLKGGVKTQMFSESLKACLPGLLLICGAFTSPDSVGRETDLSYACKKDGVTRYVEVVTEPGFACRVRYTKPSATTFPWNARNDAGYCAPRATGLVEKLGDAGWQCDATGEESPIQPAEDAGLTLSAEDVRLILQSQIERYGRYIESYQMVGKTCYFYPTEAQFGNLCGDAREEAVIVYTCEVDTGGWDQNLAVFLEIEAEPLVTEVGRSGFRQVSSYHIEKDQLMMETEKINPVGSSTDAQYPVKKSAIQCRYSGASDWELFEQQ
jgi:hypothetical protein